ncbi:conserved hypothetical protein [Uncinocarpus reesii 1704]|uniref:PSP1 C-terminal domain-containing protein n=1 Tax=Uncinocarpus reesii (strain UAMH 1704) TaxID=336963 RepID=C4JVJ8_UNCRE|nr:uncharacterized protein UREG_06590 [Uncinocarpus reesii 1704]EEP81725.1 conserved hypothetical protein [Uncinocarpus reesii 1704]
MAASSRATKPPHPMYSPASHNNNNASILLEKNRQGARRSTPDSEALASSEDENDHHGRNQSQPTPVPKPARRTSWLNEIPSSLPRKASLTASSSFSPVNSNPTTPAADQVTWASATSPGLTSSINWGSSGNGSFPWGTGIWNTENRKEPPSRLSEVLQSPTSMHPPTSSFGPADDVISPTARSATEATIPFAIPLHPTPKTYRSQSYSVGQLDPETTNVMPVKAAAPVSGARSRNSAQYSVQRRSSRPSMLGDLGRVREDEDDISPNDSEGNSNWSSNQARTIEQLTLENTLLRQAASNQPESARLRDRTLSSTSANSGYSIAQGHKLHPIHGSVPEESDLAVEDTDELGEFPGYNTTRSNARRRFSLHSANLEKQFPNFASLDNIKRAQWQSSLGFGGVNDVPQSRRHSFADVPTRQASSFSGAAESQPLVGAAFQKQDDGTGTYAEAGMNAPSGDNREYLKSRNNQSLAERAKELEGLRARQFAASYFSGHDISTRATEPATSGISTALHQAYVMPNAYGRQHAALAQPHQNQQLFVVTFKCCRADVFYIQEDTGLQVKPGDLVIVEADRGTDLGTVAQANVSWQKARELKDRFAEEHYKWLMLFSRQNQSGTPHAVNPNGPSGLSGSAVGGMGPQSPHTGQEAQGADIKPKLIKRLAQNHEIQTLRDKEGNEAKAKRVCQQKVVEHRLNMEILDAEFQMDWKKLTFYYFADTYINFNSLVTDLFKIYKTRIWMSAINPASFVTPTAGLQPPGALGPSSSLSLSQDPHSDRRRQHDYKQYGTGINQGLSPGIFAEPLNRDMSTQAGVRSPYLDPYQSLGGARQPEAGYSSYTPGLQHQADPFGSYQTNYGTSDPNATGFGATGVRSGYPGQEEWMNRFQGLSLGS